MAFTFQMLVLPLSLSLTHRSMSSQLTRRPAWLTYPSRHPVVHPPSKGFGSPTYSCRFRVCHRDPGLWAACPTARVNRSMSYQGRTKFRTLLHVGSPLIP